MTHLRIGPRGLGGQFLAAARPCLRPAAEIGGEDKTGNLWPRPSGENRSSGSIIKHAEIKNAQITNAGLKFAQGKSATVADAFAAMKKKGKALWLIITKTHQR